MANFPFRQVTAISGKLHLTDSSYPFLLHYLRDLSSVHSHRGFRIGYPESSIFFRPAAHHRAAILLHSDHPLQQTNQVLPLLQSSHPANSIIGASVSIPETWFVEIRLRSDHLLRSVETQQLHRFLQASALRVLQKQAAGQLHHLSFVFAFVYFIWWIPCSGD
ncbi:hypothetical protein HHK36_011935 [Tetracentron sinense]|uniref:Uncharacterized protein n=1 Tax=Tetracentron sinense TaxID=13715 RepID=A0A834ZAD0_TETSI|nr:hypothetical protein HHK36_011935 [Tetracentron sinense]